VPDLKAINYTLEFFASVRKEEKAKKMSNFLKAYISRMAYTIYFKFGMCSLLICQHLHSELGLV